MQPGDNDWLEIYNPTDQAIDLRLLPVIGWKNLRPAEDPSLMMASLQYRRWFLPRGTVVAPARKLFEIVARSSINIMFSS
jgi:hypothetical protein